MTAEEFAKEFINDIPDRKIKIDDTLTVFSMSVYADDPELKILRKELNKAGYKLILEKPSKKPYEQEWRLVKI